MLIRQYLRLRVTDSWLVHEEHWLALPISILSSTTGFDESLKLVLFLIFLLLVSMIRQELTSPWSVRLMIIFVGNQLILARDVDFESNPYIALPSSFS